MPVLDANWQDVGLELRVVSARLCEALENGKQMLWSKVLAASDILQHREDNLLQRFGIFSDLVLVLLHLLRWTVPSNLSHQSQKIIVADL